MKLITAPPPAAAIAAMQAIEGVRIVPTMLNTQVGPDGNLGPENARAVLILQGTFADEVGFEEFWTHVAQLMVKLAHAPGFIRRYSFADGPHYTLIALWRSVEHAHAFFATDDHQAAMRTTFARRWQYTHFAGLWEVAAPRQRVFFCQTCDGIAQSTQTSCARCGTPLVDPFGGNNVPVVASLS